MIRRAVRVCFYSWIIATIGCDPDPVQGTATEAPQPSSSGEGSSSGSGGGSEGTGEGTSTGEPEPVDPTDGGEIDCDLWTQNCPEGQKCTLYDNDGPQELDGAKCVPVVEPPKQLGDLCQWEDGFGSGLDDCDEGLFCWVQGPNDQGQCVPLCQGDPEDPQCPEGTACADGVGYFLYVCLPECEPLQQNCLEGTMCVLSRDAFVCALDKSGDAGQLYDPCTYANACDPGHVCAKPDVAEDCVSQGVSGCCVPFCQVGGMSCPPELECVTLLDPDTQPEYSHVGVCMSLP